MTDAQLLKAYNVLQLLENDNLIRGKMLKKSKSQTHFLSMYTRMQPQ